MIKNMIRLIKLIIWLVVITGGILLLNYTSYENTLLTNEASTLEIKPGATFTSVLTSAGANSLFTKIYLKENLPDFELQVGSYNIPENADARSYLDALRNPINETDEYITILEGWNIFDIDQYLTRQELIDA
jgi:cell division protein YceG involved in septum cleavage